MTLTDDTYQGYTNRETWAFNLHWQNDPGLYYGTVDYANSLDLSVGDHELGAYVVDYWRTFLDEEESVTDGLRMWDREVGSWWRINRREVGEAVREAVEAEA